MPNVTKSSSGPSATAEPAVIHIDAVEIELRQSEIRVITIQYDLK